MCLTWYCSMFLSLFVFFLSLTWRIHTKGCRRIKNPLFPLDFCYLYVYVYIMFIVGFRWLCVKMAMWVHPYLYTFFLFFFYPYAHRVSFLEASSHLQFFHSAKPVRRWKRGKKPFIEMYVWFSWWRKKTITRKHKFVFFLFHFISIDRIYLI